MPISFIIFILLIHSFIHSFIYLFIYSFIYLFIYLFIYFIVYKLVYFGSSLFLLMMLCGLFSCSLVVSKCNIGGGVGEEVFVFNNVIFSYLRIGFVVLVLLLYCFLLFL